MSLDQRIYSAALQYSCHPSWRSQVPDGKAREEELVFDTVQAALIRKEGVAREEELVFDTVQAALVRHGPGSGWSSPDGAAREEELVFDCVHAALVAHSPGPDGAAREEELVFDCVHAALVAHGTGQLQRLELRCVADGRVLLHAAIATPFWCQPQTDVRVHMVTPDGTRWILMFASPTDSSAFLLAIGFARALATSLSAHLASAAAQTYPPHAYVPVPPTLQDVLLSTGGHRSQAEGGDTVQVALTAWAADPFTSPHLPPPKPFLVTQGKGVKLLLGSHKALEALEQGVVGMRKGGRRFLAVSPSAAGRGDFPSLPPNLPPNTLLFLDITLHRMRKPGAAAAAAAAAAATAQGQSGGAASSRRRKSSTHSLPHSSTPSEADLDPNQDPDMDSDMSDALSVVSAADSISSSFSSRSAPVSPSKLFRNAWPGGLSSASGLHGSASSLASASAKTPPGTPSLAGAADASGFPHGPTSMGRAVCEGGGERVRGIKGDRRADGVRDTEVSAAKAVEGLQAGAAVDSSTQQAVFKDSSASAKGAVDGGGGAAAAAAVAAAAVVWNGNDSGATKCDVRAVAETLSALPNGEMADQQHTNLSACVGSATRGQNRQAGREGEEAVEGPGDGFREGGTGGSGGVRYGGAAADWSGMDRLRALEDKIDRLADITRLWLGRSAPWPASSRRGQKLPPRGAAASGRSEVRDGAIGGTSRGDRRLNDVLSHHAIGGESDRESRRGEAMERAVRRLVGLGVGNGGGIGSGTEANGSGADGNAREGEGGRGRNESGEGRGDGEEEVAYGSEGGDEEEKVASRRREVREVGEWEGGGTPKEEDMHFPTARLSPQEGEEKCDGKGRTEEELGKEAQEEEGDEEECWDSQEEEVIGVVSLVLAENRELRRMLRKSQERERRAAERCREMEGECRKEEGWEGGRVSVRKGRLVGGREGD
ncbi:unnamed protein product [Closterium sp. Naga37s-1]|nr:unnamed protein product [Closterium sp. Naga37s-1]